MEWQRYEEEKQRFLEEHPDATPQEIEEFCKKLAERLGL